MIILAFILFFISGILLFSLREDYVEYKQVKRCGSKKYAGINLVCKKASLLEKLYVTAAILFLAIIALVMVIL